MTSLAIAFFSLGISELLIIGVVALLVFGGRLPEVMRNLGRTYARFRQGLDDVSYPIRRDLHRLDSPAATTPPPSYVRTPEGPPPDEPPSEDAQDAHRPARMPPASGSGAADEPPPV